MVQLVAQKWHTPTLKNNNRTTHLITTYLILIYLIPTFSLYYIVWIFCMSRMSGCTYFTHALNHMMGHITSAWLECCIRVAVVSLGASLCVIWNSVPDANQTSSGCLTALSAESKIWFAFMFRLRIKVRISSVTDRWFFMASMFPDWLNKSHWSLRFSSSSCWKHITQ